MSLFIFITIPFWMYAAIRGRLGRELYVFHHTRGYQAVLTIGKINDPVFRVYFFYVIFIYQNRPLTRSYRHSQYSRTWRAKC